MVRKAKPKELTFELFDELKQLDMDILHEESGWELPRYIIDNLKHIPRSYQSEAIRYFHYTQTSETFKHRKPNQLMFNMATGAGKTDLMAGLILYLFKEKGYQNFLFTVNTNGVLSKTVDNLTNVQSAKFLFNSHIEIDGERISVNQISGKFPDFPNKNDINIKFLSIQTLTNELFTQAENVMSLKDYQRAKMVILADEAHHYSASTKKKSKKELEKASWEQSLLSLLHTHTDNLLLEFTATLDFDDESIYEKYRDKIIYRYALDSYIKDGFSKNVRRIQTGNSNEENMLSVVLLSEYRRKFALETFGIDIKPIILFKSQKIDASHEANSLFNEMIDNLTVKTLREFLTSQSKSFPDEQSHTLQLAYQYYLEQDDLSTVVKEIRRGFSPMRILNANDTDNSSKGLLETGQYQALNSLESPSNLYRVIFAVAKLTEGWDVLNLYDIVRISSLGKVTDKKDTKSTNSEAQLIGRGARYNPFSLNQKISYQRRFDEDDETASLLLETLHYHTLNEPQYIKNLMISLDKMNLATGTDGKNPQIEIKLKPSFKKTRIYKTGKLYYNETEEIPDSHYKQLRDYGIEISKIATIPYFKSTYETDYLTAESIESKTSQLREIDIRYFKKSISRSNFFRFSNLKKYLPNLKSIEDFWGENWLDLQNLVLSVITEKETIVEDFSAIEKLKIVDNFFNLLSSKIKAGYRKERGTNRFIGYSISKYLADYRKRVPNYDTAKHSNSFIEQNVSNISFEKFDFFAYQSAIINRNEENLVNAIANHVDELKEKYGDVFLIRMDENMLKGTDKIEQLKLHQFEKNPRELTFSGFQPDFILLLQNKDYHLQIFIEPKGEQLVEKDRWKEELLSYINDHQEELIFEDEVDGVIIKGLKFYNKENSEQTLNQLAQIALEKPQFGGNIRMNLF
ncbi:restriction endonuclease [Streptococcus agalactiae]|uniref:DEAD/DEAH box helicase family protein n=1 Tax=Streptococcus agalactiae TaxID=1311 RepID=UPI000E766F2F|nr:DEAD/DEAH box helicase family protein [Streptococcus agalactiae]RJX42541.1 restriction endonuclease [Streptococcus agalactiae]